MHSVDYNLASGRLFETRKHIEQGGLAGAGCAEYAAYFPVVHGKTDIIQCDYFFGVCSGADFVYFYKIFYRNRYESPPWRKAGTAAENSKKFKKKIDNRREIRYNITYYLIFRRN
jgi:hypothetical protein